MRLNGQNRGFAMITTVVTVTSTFLGGSFGAAAVAFLDSLPNHARTHEPSRGGNWNPARG